MQKKLKICVIIIFLGIILLLSCRKLVSCEGCYEKNQPPVAAAGNDTIIILPTDSVSLNGSSSNDPDGSINKWLWKKISGPLSYNFSNATAAITVVKDLSAGTSGPLSFIIDNANAVRTQVTNLVEGVYQFELKVTDAGMLVSKDTINVFSSSSTSIISFTDQVWINLCYQPDIPGACWINSDSPSYGLTINDTANVLPDSASPLFRVWVKMDTSSVWEEVPHKCWQFPDPYPQSNFTYCITPQSLSVWSWFFSLKNSGRQKSRCENSLLTHPLGLKRQ